MNKKSERPMLVAMGDEKESPNTKDPFSKKKEKTPEQKIRDTDLALKNTRKPPKKKSVKKLEKAELLKLMKEKGKDSIDSDHEALIKYIFPKNDLTPQENRNKNYTRRRILTAIDLIMTYCDIYPKKSK